MNRNSLAIMEHTQQRYLTEIISMHMSFRLNKIRLYSYWTDIT